MKNLIKNLDKWAAKEIVGLIKTEIAGVKKKKGRCGGGGGGGNACVCGGGGVG